MPFVKDPNAPAVAAPAPSSFGDIFANILSGLESAAFGIVLSVLAMFANDFRSIAVSDLATIGNNFRLFLAAIGNGTPWGVALADMMTADWNTVEEGAKELALDFCDAVANALQAAGLLPQGK